MNEEDLSNIFEKFNINKDSINPEMVNNLIGMLNDKNSYNSSENNNENSNHDFGKNIIPEYLKNKLKIKAYRYKGYWKDVVVYYFCTHIELR